VVVDFVQGHEDLRAYPLVIVPSLFVATDAQLEALDAAAHSGSTVLVTAQSAIVDESLQVRLNGYLGKLQETLGIWIEEFAPLAGAWQRPGGVPVRPESTVRRTVDIVSNLLPGGRGTGVDWTEVVRLRDAEVRAHFSGGSLDGQPALTRRDTGAGAAWYMATRFESEELDALIRSLLTEAGIASEPVISSAEGAGWVETVRRGGLTFVINHGPSPVTLALHGKDLLNGQESSGQVLDPHEVAVIEAAMVGPLGTRQCVLALGAQPSSS
jgi:beta-galactosidase